MVRGSESAGGDGAAISHQDGPARRRGDEPPARSSVHDVPLQLGVRGGTAPRQPLPGTREAWPQRVSWLIVPKPLLAAFQYCTHVGVNPRGWTVGVGWIDRLRVSGCIHTLEFLRRPVAEGGVQASSIVYLLKEVGESVG